MYPFRIFYKVYFKGKNLSQIKIAGKNLNPSDIRREAATEYADLAVLYSTYSSFVHPSMEQLQYQTKNGTNPLEVTKKEKKEVAADMVKVNQVLKTLLLCQVFRYNTGIIAEEGTNTKKD